MLGEQLRLIECAPRSQLDDLSRAIWKDHAAGFLSDEDAQSLAEAIQARRSNSRSASVAQGKKPSLFPPRRLQRSPDRKASIERRRRLALSGPLPPAIRAQFTTGELAVLRIIADEVRDHNGACDASLAEIAARAGVCRTLVHNTLRRAALLGLLTIEERRRPGRRNLTNLVRVISREWLVWLKHGLREGGVFRKVSPTGERISKRGENSTQQNRRKGYPRDKEEPEATHSARFSKA